MLTQAIKENYRGHIITATLNDDDYSYNVAVNSTTYNDEVACHFLDDTFADIMTDIDDGICY
jgi:hypothetical protein